MNRTINVTVQRGINHFTNEAIYRVYDANGFLLGPSCDTEDEALNGAACREQAELVVVSRTEINW